MVMNEESNAFGMGQGCPVHGDEHMKECSMCGAEFCRICVPRSTVCPDCAEQSEDDDDETKDGSDFDDITRVGTVVDDDEKDEKDEKEDESTEDITEEDREKD
jgi:hypothetical protein